MQRYIIVETLIGMAINAAISAGFAFFVFGGRAAVGLWGTDGLALDFVPQTFMVALMSALIPSLLTRRRVAAGAIHARGAPSLLPRNLLLRALLLALLATTLLGGGATMILAVLLSGPVPFAALLPFKIAYGALVSALITPLALQAALAGPIPEGRS
jgi:hypothetical protein